MSSRFSLSSGYSSRGDRSPPQHYSDRRPSLPPGPRDDPNLTPLGREPPRGPKALIDPPRGGLYAGRGRGYPPRNDYRDRDRDRDRDRERDFRDGPPFRRDDRDRDWNRRDRMDRDFDMRDGPRPFRRSRSPQPRDSRDFRDSRDLGPPPRDGDIVRMRRNSRDSLLSSSSNPGDGPPSNQNMGHPPPHPPMRGGLGRGRGRGDWEGGRGRGRGHYMDDRDPFRRRSRSRDGWWDRDRDRDFRDRDRDRDFDRRERFDRRDDERRPERDDRDRPLEPWKKDIPPTRAEARVPSGPRSSSIPPSGPLVLPRSESKIQDQPTSDPSRKPSTTATLPPTRDPRRESDRPESLMSRAEMLREPIASKGSPPPSAPQVPAFGSVTLPPSLLSVERPSQPSSQPQPAVSNKPDRSRPDAIASATAKEAPREAPTEPKAHRADIKTHSSIPSSRESLSESWSSHNVLPRHEKPSHDVSPPTAPAALLKREQAAITTVTGESRSHHENFTSTSPPLGPAQAISPVLSRSKLPPTTRGGSPQTSPRMTFTSVPTGPRAGVRPSVRGGHVKSKQWLRPGYKGAPPSSPSLGNRRESHGDKDFNESLPPVDNKKDLNNDGQPNIEEKVVQKETLDKVEPPTANEEISHDAISSKLPGSKDSEEAEEQKQTARSKHETDDNSQLLPDFTRSSDEEEEDINEVFTEEYLRERKELFEKSMGALKAEMPPPTLEDPVIVELLMKVQLLGMLVDGSVPEEPEPSAVETNAERSKKAISTQIYKKEMDVDEDLTAATPAKTVIPAESVDKDTITVENLPFLVSGPPTPISELDVYQENIKTHERIQEAIRSTVAKQRKDASEKNKRLREEYAAIYRPWRLTVRAMDQKKEEERKSSTPSAATPPVTPAPTSASEGRGETRRYKGNSELDFQNALKASAISAQEESERRRLMEATARPDLEKEAVIPDMYEKYQIEAGIFKDTNNKVDPADALVVYGFLPPPDDFTVEEHKLFTDAFMAYPKKWGKIADELPGRTYAQCISHYYMTKEEIKYKAKLNKRWRSQRRARKSTTRPKSNALMSDLKANGDDEESVQMTETGRPRRAAAPTFGGDAATENENSRRGGNKESDQGEKPASRRGRAGAGARGGRRGRGAAAAAAQQQQQQHPPQQPQQQPPQLLQAPLSIQAQHQAAVAFQQPLASTTIAPGVPLMAKQEPRVIDGAAEMTVHLKEQERENEELLSKPRTSRARGKDAIYVFDAAGDLEAAGGKSEMGYGSMQPTSYWSVPEVRDFPILLAHFGRDFEGISNFMKTKTPIMVKNYFQRKIDSGNNEFEEIVKVTEIKKMRGEPTGPLPTPNPTPKRRYEATPSAVNHRPLAPHTDMEHAEDGRLGHKKASATMSPPVQVRPAPEIASDRSLSRYPSLAQATGAPPSTSAIMPDDPLRNMRQPGAQPAPPRTFTGPRMGYFTEDRREARASSGATLAGSRVPELQPSPRAAPSTQGPDIGRLEPLTQQLRARRDFHGPPTQYQPAQPPLYMQAPQSVVVHTSAMSSSHSRHASLTGSTAPGSPAQNIQKHTPDVSPIRRSSFGHGQTHPTYYPYPSSNIHPRTTVSPVKEAPAPTPTPQEAPRQVPAKRSNIMSILNDEPEELPPRKRFASEMTSSPRITYGKAEPSGLRHEEKASYFSHTQQQQSSQGPPPHQAPSGRPSYSDYSSYQPSSLGSASAASGPPNHDWMARFDPRSQTQQSAESIRPTPTPAPPTQYVGSGGYQHSQATSNSQPPAASQSNTSGAGHRGYQGYPPPHGQGAPTPPLLTSNGRDSSSSAYRHQNTASPSPHQSVLSYGPRPVQSPAQSPATSLNILPPRQQSGPGPSYSSTHSQASSPHPLASQHRSSHSGHQTYQQHVQALVNGQQPSSVSSGGRTSIGIAGGGPPNTASPYTTPAHLPPSQQQQHGGPSYRPGPGSLSNTSSSSNLGIGRSYSPPPAPTLGGIPYPGNGPAPAATGGHIHHTPYPHPHESHPSSAHNRVYSQGGSAPSSR